MATKCSKNNSISIESELSSHTKRRQNSSTTSQSKANIAMGPMQKVPPALPAQFYVVRPSGIATPLIAIDELPHNITIDGVPRMLSIDDIENMIRMPGKFETRKTLHKMIDRNDIPAAGESGQAAVGFGLPKSKVDVDIKKLFDVKAYNFTPGARYFGIDEQAPKEKIKALPTDSEKRPEPELFEPLPQWKDRVLVTELLLKAKRYTALTG